MGGWDTLNDWLQDVKEEENYPVLTELLKVYQALPVSVDILKTNNAAKTIKQLCKSENEGTVNIDGALGPVVQSLVSLTSSLRGQLFKFITTL